MMSKTAYDAGRKCDNCGAKSPPFWPRKRNQAGELLCDACFGKEARIAYYKVAQFEPGDEVKILGDDGYREGWFGGYEVVDETEAGVIVRQFGASEDELITMDVDQVRFAKVAHDSPGTDILRHCPFCGAGQLTGRSDGTAECGFCDAVFTVQTQPNLPSTPQTVGDELYMHPEMSEPGVPEDELDPMEDQPEGSVLPLTEEESGSGLEDGDNPFDDIEKMTFRINGATVSSGEYIKHLALKYADDRGVVLREIKASRSK
jgi:ribosomal protein L37AE/L43A